MTSPLRRQYLQIKRQYPDTILFFRLGDFYETFDEDAQITSRALDIALTGREMGKGQRVPMAGIPHHALETYLKRLLSAGHKVALCEQVQDAADAKGLVDREVVRVVTPGTIIEPSMLEQRANNYLAAVVVEGIQAGLAYADITTGEFATTTLLTDDLALEMDRLSPSEIVVPEGSATPLGEIGAPVTPMNPLDFDAEDAPQAVLDHFGATSLEPYGCQDQPLAARAAGAIVAYLKETQKTSLPLLTSLRTYSTTRFMTLDAQTRRNLELFQAGRWGGSDHTLLSVLDATRTPMGARLVRRWLGQPLLDLEALNERLEGVAFFHAQGILRQQALDTLSSVSDLERLVNRITGGNANPREVASLRRGLEAVPKLLELLGSVANQDALGAQISDLNPCEDVAQLIASSLTDEPTAPLGEGRVIREGFSEELDEFRYLTRNAREYIAGLERKERERTGIKNLRVGYNRVFGYYIEVSNSNQHLVPDDFIRRQTLVNGERFITPELKEAESRILNAQERLSELETSLFRQMCREVAESAPKIQQTAVALANLDVLAGLAQVAADHGFVRPVLSEGTGITIRDGWHPVVDQVLPPGSFVPNDTVLSNDDAQVMIITGPNMAGKSTYIRQVALIVLMAQIGSFVPAREAAIGRVDRIFTRVGLQDDLTTGQSTFMVEMVETATILHHATPRSLIILDEIGRGTSTYDGLSIAQAVAEFIHNNPRLGCKTLFATHYHELTELAKTLPRIRNYNVAVTEEDGNVVFLHRIVPGGADRSYGVHVAQLAGLPQAAVQRAWEVLSHLEGKAAERNGRVARRGQPSVQSLLFGTTPPVVEALLSLDVASMTPLEAINKLYELQGKAKDAQSG
ncbi:MAG: DNA mismatch repair protein MutS [Chloroflexi bacterium]|nr:MAG: DNA mismatch repair protein MutS [Chloroflexota bacterium]